MIAVETTAGDCGRSRDLAGCYGRPPGWQWAGQAEFADSVWLTAELSALAASVQTRPFWARPAAWVAASAALGKGWGRGGASRPGTVSQEG